MIVKIWKIKSDNNNKLIKLTTYLGSSKTYNCSNCKTTIDRDINAAKNILIKGIINL